MFAILIKNEFAILRELRDKFRGKLRGHRSISLHFYGFIIILYYILYILYYY